MKLCKLRPEVIVKLRSGIAITSVVHCVNELVANSIDASANCIAVRLNLPYCKIQVIDNGEGIPFDQMDLIGERYATSKCFSLEDLENLRCGGYRGESLASLKDMSNVMIMETHHRLSKGTFSKIFKQGNASQSKRSATERATHGTTVTIHDFMYNMPVRKQGISETLDLEDCRRSLEKIALMHPHISFSLRTDATGEICLETKKSKSLLMAFTFVYGRDKAQHLKEISLVDEKLEISGFISTNSHISTDLQLFYVNKRLISRCKFHKLLNSTLNKVLFSRQKVFGKEIPGPMRNDDSLKLQNRYAIFVLNLSCPYSEIDATFDPKKSAVIFAEEIKVINLIEKAMLKFFRCNNILSSSSPEDHCKESTETRNLEDMRKAEFPRDAGRDINVADFNEALISLPAKRPLKPLIDLITSDPCFTKPVSNTNKKTHQSSTEQFVLKKVIEKHVKTSVVTSSVITITDTSASGRQHKFAQEMDNLLSMCTKKEVNVPKRSVFSNPNPVMMLAPIKYPANELKGGTPAVKFITQLREKYQFNKKTFRSKHHSDKSEGECLQMKANPAKISRFSFTDNSHASHLQLSDMSKHKHNTCAKRVPERGKKNMKEMLFSNNDMFEDLTKVSCPERQENKNLHIFDVNLKTQYVKSRFEDSFSEKGNHIDRFCHSDFPVQHERKKTDIQNSNALHLFKFSPKKHIDHKTISKSRDLTQKDIPTNYFNETFANHKQNYISPFFPVHSDIAQSNSFRQSIAVNVSDKNAIKGIEKRNSLKRRAKEPLFSFGEELQLNCGEITGGEKQRNCSSSINTSGLLDGVHNIVNKNTFEDKVPSSFSSLASPVISKQAKNIKPITLSSDEDSPDCLHKYAQLEDLHPVFQSMMKKRITCTENPAMDPRHHTISSKEEMSMGLPYDQGKLVTGCDTARNITYTSSTRILDTNEDIEEIFTEANPSAASQVKNASLQVEKELVGLEKVLLEPEDGNRKFSKLTDLSKICDVNKDNTLCIDEQTGIPHNSSEVGFYDNVETEQSAPTNECMAMPKDNDFEENGSKKCQSKPQCIDNLHNALTEHKSKDESISNKEKSPEETEDDVTSIRYIKHTEPGTERTVFIDKVTGNSSYECFSAPNMPNQSELCAVPGCRSHFFLTHDATPFVARPSTDRRQKTSSVSNAVGVSFDTLTLDTLQEHDATVKWNVPLPNMQDCKVETLFSAWDNPMLKCAPEDTNLIGAQNLRNGYSILNMHQFTKKIFSQIKVVGQVDRKFIACVVRDVNENYTDKQLLVLFDQHAVHERVRLEQLTEELYEINDAGKKVVKPFALSPPLVVTFNSNDARILHSYMDRILMFGISLSASNDRECFEVHSLPKCIIDRLNNELKRKRDFEASGFIENLIQEWLLILEQTRSLTSLLPKTLISVLNSQACHGAVKFGDELSLQECVSLIESLSSCNLPFQCAHGRPSLAPILDLQKVVFPLKEVVLNFNKGKVNI